MKQFILNKCSNSNYERLVTVSEEQTKIDEITHIWTKMGYEVNVVSEDEFFKECNTIEDKIDKLLRHVSSIDEHRFVDNKLMVSIHWGDWKHDHLFVRDIIPTTFPNSRYISGTVTEEDGSDCYSAEHCFYFYDML